jgi:hypothetical protein
MLNLKSVVVPENGILFRMVGTSASGIAGAESGQLNEGLLIYPEQGQIKVVNNIGARIWTLLDGQTSIQEIAIKITDEYQVDLSDAEADTLEFLINLFDRNLIKLRS